MDYIVNKSVNIDLNKSNDNQLKTLLEHAYNIKLKFTYEECLKRTKNMFWMVECVHQSNHPSHLNIQTYYLPDGDFKDDKEVISYLKSKTSFSNVDDCVVTQVYVHHN